MFRIGLVEVRWMIPYLVEDTGDEYLFTDQVNVE